MSTGSEIVEKKGFLSDMGPKLVEKRTAEG
jgi:hypothetical protein